jgi:hypothetical protein
MVASSGVLAVIRAALEAGEKRLTGTCLGTGSIWEAASKATLDAINRRLPVWARRATTQRATGRWQRGRSRRENRDICSFGNEIIRFIDPLAHSGLTL